MLGAKYWKLITGLVLAAAPAAAQIGDNRSSRVHYVIEARVDTETMRLEGRETVRWENRTADAVEDLWFHLYLNAFSNNHSTHLWEGKGRVRSGREFKRGWGWQRVTSVTVDGTELVDRLEYRQPDDGREDDRSVFRVPLDAPVEPGATLEFELSWTSQLPRVQRRTGYKEDFLFIAQWFPKLGVYEGGRGWNCHQFHWNSEFYSNFGTYDVTLDLPEEYLGKVGGSGVLAGEPVAVDGRVKTRFLAPSLADRERVDWTGKSPLVHDFTWTADPDYVVHDGVFRYAEWAERFPEDVAETTRALEPLDVSLRDVNVRVFIQPEREAQWERHFEATCTALFFYGLWFGEYPYEQVTVVDPAWGGGAAGGMEYPTLFTCGTSLFTEPQMFRPESVTVHEAGHQFWYGLVANNEFEHPWMDEGFNSYTDSEALFRRYGLRRAATFYSRLPVWGERPTRLPGGPKWANALALGKLDFGAFDASPLGSSGFTNWWRDQPLLSFAEELTDPRWSDRSSYLRSPDDDPITTAAWKSVDRTSYGVNAYSRPAIALRSIAGVVGRDAFLRGMRGYAKDWRYRHPYPDDFFDGFQNASETDIDWYFDEVFRGTGTLDWSVAVSQRRSPKRRGFFQNEEGVFVDVDAEAPDEEEPEPGEEEEEEEADPEDRPYLYDVVVRRDGELRLPVKIAVAFEDDGEEAVPDQTFEWTREMQEGAKWWRLPIEPGATKVRSVIVDPERLYFLDRDMSDNQWYADSDTSVSWRWAERVLVQYQHVLHWFASTGG